MGSESLDSIAGHLRAGKMFSLAACVMLYYDILITFGDEVEKIWKKKFTLATVLWFMNRYLLPLGFVVITVAFHDPNWDESACDRYILFPEILKIFTSLAIGSIFILRLYSLYRRSTTILVTFTCLLLVELVVKIWAFTDGTRLNLPAGLVGCILVGKENNLDRFVYTWVAELMFDSTVFVATLSRIILIYRRHRTGAAIPLVGLMMRDGIIYFLVIFASNVVTVTFFLVLPADLKAINASFSTLITSLMVSRLILNLRTQAARPRAVSHPSVARTQSADVGTSTRISKPLPSVIIGNLGELVDTHWFEDSERDMNLGCSATGDTIASSEVLDMDCDSGCDKKLSLDSEIGLAVSTPSPTPLPAHIIVEVTRCVNTEVSEERPRRVSHSRVGTGCEFDTYAGGRSGFEFPRGNGVPTSADTLRCVTVFCEHPRSRDSQALGYESDPGYRRERERAFPSFSESSHASMSEQAPISASTLKAMTSSKPATVTAQPNAIPRRIASPWCPPPSWRVEAERSESSRSSGDIITRSRDDGDINEDIELKIFKSESPHRTWKLRRPSTS